MIKYHQKNKTFFKTYLKDLWQNADLFSQDPQFRVLKNSSFSTSIGIFCTFSIICLCAVFLFMELQTLFYRSNPSTIMTENLSIDTNPYPLLMTNFTLGIMLTDQNMAQLKTKDTHWTMQVQNCNRQKYKDQQTNQTKVNQTCTVYPLEPCGKQHFVTKIQQEYYANTKLGHIYCLNSEMWKENPPVLQGNVQSSKYQYLTIKISECKNTTENQSCASKEEIDKELMNGYFAMQIQDNLVQMSNFDSPFKDMITLTYTSFSIQSSKSNFQYMKIIDSQTDVGLVGTDVIEESNLIVQSNRESQDLYNGEFFIFENIMIDTRSLTYTRSYSKIQDILGNVGGLWQAIFLIVGSLLNPITSSLMNFAMANKLFRFETDEKDEKDEKDDIIQVQQGRTDIVIEQLPNNQNCASSIKSSKSMRMKKSQSALENIKDQNQMSQYIKQKKSTLKLGLKDSILIGFGCKKKLKKQVTYATDKFMSKLDVAFIIKKLYELEKLKFVLLNENQLNLFNYLPKPLIPNELFESEFEKKLIDIEQNKAYKFILQDEKSDLLKLQQAFISYVNLKKCSENSEVDNTILEILDQDIVDLFESFLSNQAQTEQLFINSPIILSKLSDLDSPKSYNEEEYDEFALQTKTRRVQNIELNI